MSCRCTCKAYDGHCDCWFDGKSTAEADLRARLAAAEERAWTAANDERARIVALMRNWIGPIRELADDIEDEDEDEGGDLVATYSADDPSSMTVDEHGRLSAWRPTKAKS